MNENIAPVEDDVRHMLRALSEEVQASLALSRVAVTAAAASPESGPSVEQALGQELDRSRRLAGSRRTTRLLEQVQRGLRKLPDEQQRADALAWALIAAADALPDAGAPEAAHG